MERGRHFTVATTAAPLGRAANVTPGGHPHMVFRSGYAVALALPDVILPAAIESIAAVEPEPAANAEPSEPAATPGDAIAAQAETVPVHADSAAEPEAPVAPSTEVSE